MRSRNWMRPGSTRSRVAVGTPADCGPAAAGAGIAVLILQLQAAAGALEREAPRPARYSSAAAYSSDRSRWRTISPSQSKAEILQGAQDAGRGPRDFARPIQILDAQQPAAPMRARIEVTGHRRIEGAQVQVARRRRCESAYIAAARRLLRAISGSGRRGRRTAFRGARAAPGLPPTAWRPAAPPGA